MEANKAVTAIDAEIQRIHRIAADLYAEKFQQLEGILLNPLEYVQTVLRIKNEGDLNKVDFSGILSNHQKIAVTVSGS